MSNERTEFVEKHAPTPPATEIHVIGFIRKIEDSDENLTLTELLDLTINESTDLHPSEREIIEASINYLKQYAKELNFKV